MSRICAAMAWGWGSTPGRQRTDHCFFARRGARRSRYTYWEERMTKGLLSSLAALLLVGLASAPATPVQAQDYPNNPITVIVPFAAGGPTDTVARLVAESMSKTLGQQV